MFGRGLRLGNTLRNYTALNELFTLKEVRVQGLVLGKWIFCDCASAGLTPEETDVSRQSYAGLLWSKQFYHYIIHDWLIGDPHMPTPPSERLKGRNSEAEWRQLFNRDIVSMPDKWEYPWVSFGVHSQ